MNKSNSKKIAIFLSSVIFITSLSVFLSFVLDPKYLSSSNEVDDKFVEKNLDLNDEILKTEKINSIIEFKMTNFGYKKIFSRRLIKLNLYSIIEEAINMSSDINYHLKEMNSKIFFKFFNENKISIKLELIPKNNYYLKFHSKFKLIIK